ncbi:unannotated protein [freshwater metagenome]|uniref:Unannotated protein n=1 Tax=freshwater metagenome TaxID=449393 RepID=A0A6J6RMD8_9ZZZZ
MHAHRHGVVAAVLREQLTDREQLDHAAHLARRLHVGSGDLGDALAVDVGGGDPGVEGERGQDRGLRRGIEALDVGGRVGLRVAELLGLLERLAEAGAGAVHLVEDEVGGAVDDAEHPRHAIAGQRLAQRAQDRDRPRDSRLVVEVAPGPLGSLVERRAVLGEQRLVGRHDAGSVGQRGEDEGAGRLDAADHLDHQVDVVACHQALGVGGEQALGHVDVAGRVEAAYGDAGQLDRRADARRQVARLLAEQTHHLRAHRAAAQHRHLERCEVLHQSSPTSVANRSSSVSRRTTTRATPSRTAITGGRSAWL